MAEIPRRLVLGTIVAGAAGAAATVGATALGRDSSAQVANAADTKLSVPRQAVPRTDIVGENKRPGSDAWRVGVNGTRGSDDHRLQICGYASQPGVDVGGSIDFHVSMAKPGPFVVEIYRFGHYQGRGARQVATSAVLAGRRQPAPVYGAEMGTITCPWAPSWTLHVPEDWTTGFYLAVFTSSDKYKYRSYAPFVVRDSRRTADLCVILPVTTYQAYNLWPSDGINGKSLYYGFKPKPDPAAAENPLDLPPPAARPLDPALRSRKVSFLRPYSNRGLPTQSKYDTNFIAWAERTGYSLTYATSLDLHAGRINPRDYKGLVFSGHDEYWSTAMRDQVTKAVAQGVSLAFMSANNVYWRVRIEESQGVPEAGVLCYRNGDPIADRSEVTCRWRDVEGLPNPEQGLLGVQFNGIVAQPAPLVVESPDHWFWQGTGVKAGDSIAGVVAGEADGFTADTPRPPGARHTLLSSSPYTKTSGGTVIQNTSVSELDNGAIVFDAASLTWNLSLTPQGDPRIWRASKNVLDRITRQARP